MSIYNNREYREFINGEDAEEWGALHYPTTTKMNANSQERSELIRYIGCEFINLNTALRNRWRAIGDNKKYLQRAEKLKAELMSHSLPENIIVYRYVKFKDFKRGKVGLFFRNGTVCVNKGFISTTLIKEALKEKAKLSMCDCVLKIYLPKGIHGVYVSRDFGQEEIWNEYEFLLSPNTKLKVISMQRNYNGMEWLIECEAIM